jgi:general secretion pathway protein I
LASTQPAAPTAGFTLIEVLAAIVILVLALTALFSAHNSGLRGATAIDEHLQARLLAQSLLAQWSRGRIPQGPSQGRSGQFVWAVSVAPYAGGLPKRTGEWTLYELAVTVAWPGGREIRLTTLRLLQRS